MKIFISTFAIIAVMAFTSSQAWAGEKEIRLEIMEDAYIESIFFDEPHGLLPQLILGNGNSSREGYTRLYMRYETPYLSSIHIDDIKRVKLKLYQKKSNNIYDYTVGIAKPMYPWTESTMTWQNDFLTPGNILGFCTIKAEIGWIEIDITDIFMEHLSGQTVNDGLIIFMQVEEEKGGVFWSKDCVNAIPSCDSQYIPYVSIIVEAPEPPIQPNITISEVQTTADGNSTFTWESNLPANTKYSIEISLNDYIVHSASNIIGNAYRYRIAEEGRYKVRVGITNEEYISNPKEFTFSPPQTEEKIEKVAEEIEKESEYNLNQLVEEITNVAKKSLEILESNTTATPQGNRVLGATDSLVNNCTYNVAPNGHKSIKGTCKFTLPAITNTKAKHSKSTGTSISLNLTAPQYIDVTVNHKSCLKPTLTNPITYFKCIEYISKVEKYRDIKPYIDVYIYVDGKWYPTFKTTTSTGYNITSNLSFKPKGQYIQAKYLISSSRKVSKDIWVDIFESSAVSKPAKYSIESVANPPYKFPLSKITNVNQWHGKTAYSTNHTGIDFEAANTTILATSSGTIEYIGWDSSSGKCLSGGNFVLLKHSDGKYSTYLHLKSFTKGLKKGSKVKMGDIIGVSGNSGWYNCEPLSNHLHFEVRNGKAQSTHINPVPLINTDWSKIKTAKAHIYPGRLTGNNPHPTY